MKTSKTLLALTIALLLSVSFSQAQTTPPTTPIQHGEKFVDANGDGYNDLAPDADGDGIPNGQDPDFVKPQDGSGRGAGKGRGFNRFVDEDGDGINDRLRDDDKDGVANCQDGDWVRPMDGAGYRGGKGNQPGRGFGQGAAGQTPGQGQTPAPKGPGGKGRN